MPATGVQQKFFAKLETGFGNPIAFDLDDAVDLRSMPIEPSQEETDIVSHVGTSSPQGAIIGVRGGKWTAESDVMPVAAGLAPDFDPFLEAAFGQPADLVGDTSAIYSLSDGATPKSLSLQRLAGTELCDVGFGAYVEQVMFDIGRENKITANGSFAVYGSLRGAPTVLGAYIATDTVITMAAGDGGKVLVGLYVQFADEDNGGVGYLVTARLGDTITIAATGLAGPLTGGERVKPLELSQNIAGTRVGGVANILKVGGTDFGIITGNVAFQTGIIPRDQESSSANAVAVGLGMRAYTGKIDVYFLDENAAMQGQAWDGTIQDVELHTGIAVTGGVRMKLLMPAIRLAVNPVEIPDSDFATASISFKVYQDTDAADEFQCAWIA